LFTKGLTTFTKVNLSKFIPNVVKHIMNLNAYWCRECNDYTSKWTNLFFFGCQLWSSSTIDSQLPITKQLCVCTFHMNFHRSYPIHFVVFNEILTNNGPLHPKHCHLFFRFTNDISQYLLVFQINKYVVIDNK